MKVKKKNLLIKNRFARKIVYKIINKQHMTRKIPDQIFRQDNRARYNMLNSNFFHGSATDRVIESQLDCRLTRDL